MSNRLDPDQARQNRADILSGLIWVQTIWKSFKQPPTIWNWIIKLVTRKINHQLDHFAKKQKSLLFCCYLLQSWLIPCYLVDNKFILSQLLFSSLMQLMIQQQLTLCMLGNFICFCCRFWLSADFFKKNFRQHDQSIKLLGSRSGLTFCQPLIWVHTVCKGDDKSHHYTCSKERAFTKAW